MSDRNDVLRKVLEQFYLKLNYIPNSAHKLWSQDSWWKAFVVLFVENSDDNQADDLLFFVYTKEKSPDGPPFTLRRKTSNELPEEFRLNGTCFDSISWSNTTLLNIVLQSNYQLTAVSCRQADLAEVARGNFSGPNVTSIVKQVFASPSKTPVNVGEGKSSAEPEPSYPAICFALDNFEDDFQDLILGSPDSCYCLVLQATASNKVLLSTNGSSKRVVRSSTASGGSSDGSGRSGDGAAASFGSSDKSLSPTAPGVRSRNNSTDGETGADAAAAGRVAQGIQVNSVTLFSAFVDYKLVKQQMDNSLKALDARERRQPLTRLVRGLESLFGGGGSGRNKGFVKKVQLLGPGGVGTAEVAVSVVEDARRPDSPPPPPLPSARLLSAANAVRRRRQKQSNGEYSSSAEISAAARALGLDFAEEEEEARRPKAETLRMFNCAIMSLSMEVDILALSVLELLLL